MIESTLAISSLPQLHSSKCVIVAPYGGIVSTYAIGVACIRISFFFFFSFYSACKSMHKLHVTVLLRSYRFIFTSNARVFDWSLKRERKHGTSVRRYFRYIRWNITLRYRVCRRAEDIKTESKRIYFRKKKTSQIYIFLKNRNHALQESPWTFPCCFSM